MKSNSRISFLADEIIRHKRLYYEAGQSEISDAAFDMLETELAVLEPLHPVLQAVGSAGKSSDNPKVKHATAMLSLQKTYDPADLYSWAKASAKNQVVGLLKVDGVSMSLVFEAGLLVQAKTRGDGVEGEDVTTKIKWVEGVHQSIATGSTGKTEIRGELYCDQRRFVKLAAEMEKLGLDRPTSTRNIVAGLLGRKANTDLMRYFNFMAFSLISGPEGDAVSGSEFLALESLVAFGFETPNHKLLISEKEIAAYIEDVKQLAEEANIPVDGAVFVTDSVAAQIKDGYTSHHPRFKMAFKWQGDTAVTRLDRINWFTSRLGIITPVAVIEPVTLSGAVITNVTLHNAAFVRSYALKSGDQIEIIRSGEVIPKFLRVTEAALGSVLLPVACPSCSSPLVDDGVRLKCPNTGSCQAQQRGQVLNWIVCVDIQDLSEKRVDLLFDNNLITKASDIYRLGVADFMKLPKIKEKMAEKLYAAIQASKTPPILKFLDGLGIEGIGKSGWRKILAGSQTLEALRRLKTSEIETVDGFAEKTAEIVVTGLLQKAEMIEAMLKAGVTPDVSEFNARPAATSGQPGTLTGMSLVITGELSRPRAQIEADILAAGGKLSSSVSKNTYALVCNETSSKSSKMKKATDLGVIIINEEGLLKLMGLS